MLNQREKKTTTKKEIRQWHVLLHIDPFPKLSPMWLSRHIVVAFQLEYLLHWSQNKEPPKHFQAQDPKAT